MQVVGYFNAHSEPVVKLDVGNISVELLVDTGFDGSLMIPSDIANQLDRKVLIGSAKFQTVTGEEFLADAFSVEIDWLGETRRIAADTYPEISEALLGSHLLKGCCLTIDYFHRTVTIIET